MDRLLILRAALSSIALFAAACGGDSRPRGTSDSGTDDASLPPGIDPTTGDDGGGDPACRSACSAGDCGKVPDGCGDFLDCGGCAEGEVCGLNTPNTCGAVSSVCTPTAAADACSGKCGIVSNGCDNVYDCGADNGGVACASDEVCGGLGGSADANTCVAMDPNCVPKTCAALGQECGLASDGCGGSLDCGTAAAHCATGEDCGTGQDYGQCVPGVVAPSCTPFTAAAACNNTCGIVSDGCNGNIDCTVGQYACPAGQRCGAVTPGRCGTGPSCTPVSEQTACAGRCGQISNGCEGVYTCGASNGGDVCTQTEECVRNSCTASAACTPRSAAVACPTVSGHKTCGLQNDSCGGTVDCGGCASDEACGLGGTSLCGPTTPVCTPTPVATACAGKCGTVANGCGGTYSCDASNGGLVCTGSEFCGALAPNRCGAPVIQCTPKSCADLGHSCGLASDGCGHVINCWNGCAVDSTTCTGTCPNTGACLSDSTTHAQSCVAGSPTCNGALCSSVPTTCAANAPTRLSGTVRTPGRGTLNRIPVPNALVYIPGDPAAALPSVFEGVTAGNTASCARCEDEALVSTGQSVLASAVTDYKGDFTLEGRIPVGVPFKLVVKIGKWRRVIEVPAGVATACATRALANDYTRLPATNTDGLSGTHLPHIAISTGRVDAMECVFRNMGIDDSEFGLPSSASRVHMFRANGARMRGTCSGVDFENGLANCSANSNAGCRAGHIGCNYADGSVADSELFQTQAALNRYDMIVWDCEGFEDQHDAYDPLVRSYVDNGGRMFASHFSYAWIEGNGTLNQSAQWGNAGTATTGTGYVSLPSGPTTRAGANATKSLVFRDWLDWQGALTGTVADQLSRPTVPQFTITDPRDRAGTSVGPSTDEWVYRTVGASNLVQQLSFNTPYGATSKNLCGRVAYSGFHVTSTDNGGTNSYFPDVCAVRALTAQEKVLVFMLFDLATCVSNGDPPKPPQCTPQTAATLCPNVNDACGFLNDGCGGVVDCAGCSAGFYCDGNTCRKQECTPASCASLGFTCGEHADGCGGIALNAAGAQTCGSCTGGQVCGLNNPGQCAGCVQITQAVACAGKNCGSVSDGCGGVYNCGTCPQGQVCGANGANICGGGSCTRVPQATACAGKTCGTVSDGCGGVYTCGVCTAPDTCGGGGAPDVCGHTTCTPLSTAQACQGLSCGWVSDGCGGAVHCNDCPNGGVCGGAGPNQCGATCTPTTCTAQGAQCGAVADRCGALLDCGQCPSGQTCGVGGANRCGTGPKCTPRSCTQADAECGLVGDGCGAVLNCGDCKAPQTCGGAGQANHCGVGTGGCNRLTCDGQAVQCGQATDGCGGLLDCGACASGAVCERGICEGVLH